MLITEKRFREILREEIKELFVRDVVMEKPDGTTETHKCDVIELLTMRLQHLEGRMLGMQSDVDQARNCVGELVEVVSVLGKGIAGLERVAGRMVMLTEACQPALEMIEARQEALPHG